MSSNEEIDILTNVINGVDYKMIESEKYEIMEIKEDPDPESFKDEDIYAEYLIDEEDPEAIEKLIQCKLEQPDVNLESLVDQFKNRNNFCKELDDHAREKVKMSKKSSRKVPKVHKCQVEGCNASFPNATRLKTHGLTHSEVRNFSCDVCGVLTKQRASMVKHKLIHLNLRYTCDICGRDFGTRLNIHHHMKIHYDTNKPICHLCGKTVSKPHMLAVHMLYSHGGERNFKCHICDKAFFTKGKLKQHIDTLHGERPWECHICLKTFAKRYRLGEHMKLRHKMTIQSPKRFVCTLCGISFDRNKLLQNHLRDKHEVIVESLEEAENIDELYQVY